MGFDEERIPWFRDTVVQSKRLQKADSEDIPNMLTLNLVHTWIYRKKGNRIEVREHEGANGGQVIDTMVTKFIEKVPSK